VIVPVIPIEPWYAQWNPNVPAVLNAVDELVPAGIFPVSQRPGVSLVEVCAIPSVFFQVIVVPFVIVSVLGLKLVPIIETVFGVVGGGGGLFP
jgi:hypothetical protein